MPSLQARPGNSKQRHDLLAASEGGSNADGPVWIASVGIDNNSRNTSPIGAPWSRLMQ